MRYDAITIDTNVFISNAFELESGLLGQLIQFNSGTAEFILSEIVVRELRKHLIEAAKNSWEKVARATKSSKSFGFLPADLVDQIDKALSAAPTPEEAADRRLKAFLRNTGAVVVAADHADMPSLIRRYFESTPPFEQSGSKKREFPDAIALLSIESWASKNTKKVIAVSKDNGWHDFAKATKSIETEPELGAALEKLQANTKDARALIEAVLTEVRAGKRPELLEELSDHVAEEVAMSIFIPEAVSAFRYEEGETHLTFKSFELCRSGNEFEFDVVRVGSQKVVAKIAVSIAASAEAQFSFSVWDSIDKDSVPMGSTRANVDTEFDASLLVTFEVDSLQAPQEVNISEVTLADTVDSIDFGEISPDRDWNDDLE